MSTHELTIRWMIRRDMCQVMEIEEASYSNPWSEREMVDYLKERCHIGQVACVGDNVAGFLLYDINAGSMRIDNISVDPAHRRNGIGYAMVQKLIEKLKSKQKRKLETYVRESNLIGQQFFRAIGFLANGLLKSTKDGEEDDYRMEYVTGPRRMDLRNRITKTGQ